MLMVARVVTPEEVGCLALILFWNNCGADMDRRPITCTHVRLHRLGLTFPTNIRVVLPLCPEEGHSLHGIRLKQSSFISSLSNAPCTTAFVPNAVFSAASSY
ncbi:jg15215 [Pararge aegeria aegeria]|uniref:Jg15215 protein n=1 Tax=Pararge aegeria aegeria TaxID=348720 RepID=A0A8S4QKS2_9NEOP|nr:jg15215 [Pararge aegeria aegeria]